MAMENKDIVQNLFETINIDFLEFESYIRKFIDKKGSKQTEIY